MKNKIEEKIVNGFIKEACEILHFDTSNIRVIYVTQLTVQTSTPYYIDITPDGCMIINKTWIAEMIKAERPTPIRWIIYTHVRMLYQQYKAPNKFNKFADETMLDANVFSCALITLKGLTINLPFSPTVRNHILQNIQLFFKKEFGFDTESYLLPEELAQSDSIWKFRLMHNSEKAYADKYSPLKTKSTVRVIDSSEKGTEENPFENVNEAFEYIKELEANAYENDDLLKSIAVQQFYYDLEHRQFRVPWASPFVSFYNNPDIPPNGFIVNQNEIHPDGTFHFTLKPNLYRKKFLYRGQSRDYPKPCTPNLFRDESKTYFLDDLIWTQEMELLLKTHPLVKLLNRGVTIMHDHFSFLMNLGGLAQHYYHKTRFLDLTSDENAAKFFATTNYNYLNDEYKPVHDTERLGMIYCYELQMPEAFQRHKGYTLSVIGKQVFMRSGAQHGFLLDMEKGIDLKKMSHVKKFYFRHNPFISDEIFKQSNYGKEYFTSDILEEAWKTEYKKRLENGIVSADTVRLNVSRNPGETFQSISQKLKTKNISIDYTYHPSFSQELLEKYYQSIKDGWWEEFCSDIYFYGGDAALYKDCLLRIPQRIEYKWAFEKKN